MPEALRRTAKTARRERTAMVDSSAVNTPRRRSPPTRDMQAFAAWFEEPWFADVIPTTVD